MKTEFDYEEGEPPAVPEAKGHLHHRARLVNFVGLKQSVTDKLAAERERQHKLQRIIDEPAQTERTLAQTVKSESLRPRKHWLRIGRKSR